MESTVGFREVFSVCKIFLKSDRLCRAESIISTGEFRFPNQPAAEIAVRTVKAFLTDNPQMNVVFNVFKDVDWGIYRGLLGKVRSNFEKFFANENLLKIHRTFAV